MIFFPLYNIIFCYIFTYYYIFVVSHFQVCFSKLPISCPNLSPTTLRLVTLSVASKMLNTQVLAVELGTFGDLKDHLERVTTFVTSNFEPDLIRRDFAIMPRQAIFSNDSKLVIKVVEIELHVLPLVLIQQ